MFDKVLLAIVVCAVIGALLSAGFLAALLHIAAFVAATVLLLRTHQTRA